jgi:hypothetical protein
VTGYGNRVDDVVYHSDATATYTREDWIRLALASLDQAGVSPRELLDAHRHGRGVADAVLVELGEEPPYLSVAR